MSRIQMSAIFQDGMVLQRNRPVCIWGTAAGCETVSVKLAGYAAYAEVAHDGAWKAYLPPMKAATGLELVVTGGEETVCLGDVAVGEVWLASGQSNMEFLLRYDAHAQEAVQTDRPDIRCFEVPKISYPGEENDFDYSSVGCWRKAVGEECLYFTAVGFYFANRLYERFKVPVGIINCTWGGTSAACFTAREYLTGPLARLLEQAEKANEGLNYDTALEEYKVIQRRINETPSKMGIVNTAPIYVDEEARRSMEQTRRYHLAPFSAFRPCGLYATMLCTIAPYTVSGVLWYQGESDTDNADIYDELIGAMIRCWRDLWGEELPFFMVQLAPFEYMVEALDFVPIRASQERICKQQEKVWLVCAMDAGMRYDIHPKDKRPIGERLALQVLSKQYGVVLEADSPKAGMAWREGSVVSILFTDCGDGLFCEGSPETLELVADGLPVTSFDAKIDRYKMTITSEMFSEAPSGRIEIRFCQKPYCIDNLYNSAGLPAFPFVVRV